jgi:uncharacterized membrane protein HdeD (DUF308 family)
MVGSWSHFGREPNHDLVLLTQLGSAQHEQRLRLQRKRKVMRITIVDADVLVQNWWAVVLRGVAAISFGMLTIFMPGISLVALVLVFGAYALADGILALVTAVRRRGATQPWGMLVFEGFVGIAAGVGTFVWPIVTTVALLYLIAGWSLVTGAFEIAAAIRLRKTIEGEWLLALSGIASIVLGVVLMLYPAPGALALVLWVGIYANIFGVLLVALGLRVRAWGKARVPESSVGVMQTSPDRTPRASHG